MQEIRNLYIIMGIAASQAVLHQNQLEGTQLTQIVTISVVKLTHHKLTLLVIQRLTANLRLLLGLSSVQELFEKLLLRLNTESGVEGCVGERFDSGEPSDLRPNFWLSAEILLLEGLPTLGLALDGVLLLCDEVKELLRDVFCILKEFGIFP